MTFLQETPISRADWLLQTMTPEHSALKALRLETDQEDHASMATDPVQGQILSMLVRMSGARRVLEVGTFKDMVPCLGVGLARGWYVADPDVNEDWGEIGRTPAGCRCCGEDKPEDWYGKRLTSCPSVWNRGCSILSRMPTRKVTQTMLIWFSPLRRAVMALDNVFWGDPVLDPANTTTGGEFTSTLRIVRQESKWHHFALCRSQMVSAAIKADEGGLPATDARRA